MIIATACLRHPGVIVLTDENEDKGSLEYEKRLPREVLQSPFVSQIRINPATDGTPPLPSLSALVVLNLTSRHLCAYRLSS